MQQRKAMCSGKRVYRGKGEADRALREIKVRNMVRGKQYKLEVYRCSVCRMWHIGTNEVGRRTARKPYVRERLDHLHHPDDS